jgi:hypothetical protein
MNILPILLKAIIKGSLDLYITPQEYIILDIKVTGLWQRAVSKTYKMTVG